VLAAEAIPRVALLPVGGALADRVNPRVVMVVADVGRAVVVGAIGATLLFGLPPLWIMAALAGLHGAGSGLFLPGSQAIVPRTVENQEVSAANGLMQIIVWLTLIVGPVVGGAIVAAQAAVAFFLDGATFVISAITLLAMRLRPRFSDAVAADTTAGGAHARSAEDTLADDGVEMGAMAAVANEEEPAGVAIWTTTGPLLAAMSGPPALTEPSGGVSAQVAEEPAEPHDGNAGHAPQAPPEALANANEPASASLEEAQTGDLGESSATTAVLEDSQDAEQAPSGDSMPAPVPPAAAHDADNGDRDVAPDDAASESERSVSMSREIGAGVAYALGQPLTRTVLIMSVLGNLAYTGVFGVALVLLSRALDPSPVTLGALLGACGIGGILGGLAAGPIGRLRRRTLLILFFWLTMAIAFALVPIVAGGAARLPFPVDLSAVNFGEVAIGGAQVGALNLGDVVSGLSPGQRLGAVAVLLGGISAVIATGETTLVTILQQRAPAELLARVFSVQFMAAGVTQPLSLIGAGLVAATYGPGVTFIGAAALFFIAAVIGLATPAVRRA
jgi:MFS family permease